MTYDDSHDAKFRVVSWNILSPELTNPKVFHKADPACLDPKYRKSKILESLEDDVRQNSIICLQEISRSSMAGDLKVWFNFHNYELVDYYYGTPRNGYMGVGIAYPRYLYDLKDIKVKNIAEDIRYPQGPNEQVYPLFIWIYGWVLWFLRFFFNDVRDLSENIPINLVREAKRRFNTVVMLNLEHKDCDQAFWVATYHMPCAWYNPAVMTLHTHTLLKYVYRTATSEPVILAGDWNSKTDSESYRLITRGGSNSLEHVSWSLGFFQKSMFSAHQDVHGSEPEHTCYTSTSYSKDGDFKDTIDYIFYYPGDDHQLDALDGVDYTEAPDELCPNLENPSDHLKLYFTFGISSRA